MKRTQRNGLKKVLGLSALTALSACGGNSKVSVNFVNSTSSTGSSARTGTDAVSGPVLSSSSIGIGSAAPTSFKVAVYEISVCEDLTINGTAFSNEKNCQKLFAQTEDSSAYSAGTVPTGVDYLDLIQTDATKEKIKSYGASIPAGTYKYGKISAYRLMKVTGSVALSNSTTVYTRSDAASSSPTDLNSSKNISATIGTSPAQEASIVWNQNGFFKFQTPWEFKGGTGVEVDLVFNADGILKGSSSCSNCILQESTSGGKGISIPILKMTPVVRTSSQKTRRERYVFTGGDLNGSLTIDLYGIKDDAAKSIYGVDVRMVYSSASTVNISDPLSAQSVSVSGDVVTLKDWENKDIAIFTRSATAGTVSATATVSCVLGVCKSASSGTTTPTSYTVAFTEL